jgi:hypothetical protein
LMVQLTLAMEASERRRRYAVLTWASMSLSAQRDYTSVKLWPGR